jgi:hypothetical protein
MALEAFERHSLEERSEFLVGENAVVEQGYRNVDGIGTTKLFIDRRHPGRFEPGARGRVLETLQLGRGR